MSDEQALGPLGSFEFEVVGSGRGGRARSSRFALRCDAVALHVREILLLSVAGAETAVKALAAGLRSSARDQNRFLYSVRVGGVAESNLTRCPAGYRAYRARLGYGLWHVLLLARREGFLPVVNDDTLWRHFRGERFTTPIVREWVPWLARSMAARGDLAPLARAGCDSGLVLAGDEALDDLVSEGLRGRHLVVPGDRPGRHTSAAGPSDADRLDDYLTAHGPLLGRRAERALDPLHVPGRGPLPPLGLLRQPFEAQAHVIEAARRGLRRQKSILIVGEMGTGKTLMGIGAAHAHAGGRPYRALVFCPGQLVDKWEREVRETVPEARVTQLETWTALLPLDRRRRPAGPEWYVIARDRAKLGARWRPAYVQFTYLADGFLRCPRCGRRLVDDQRSPVPVGRQAHDGQPGTGLWRRRSRCQWVLSGHAPAGEPDWDGPDRLVPGCGEALWQMTGEVRRYEPALFVKRRLRNFFTYLIADECHEEKGHDTAQGHALAALAAACRKVVALTGTLIGGYADHLRPLLFRLAPASLVREGLGWADATAFSERYGRVETRITERSGGRADDNRMSRGSRSTVKAARPGVMPALFGRHLIDKCVFLGLGEVARDLPPLSEECVPVRMDPELAAAYRTDVEAPLRDAIRDLLRRNDRRLLATLLQTLLAYPDYPFGWGPLGYRTAGSFVTVATPPDLDPSVVRPKERALIDLVRAERANGRQAWVFVQYTDAHDVQGRLERLLREAGLRVGGLRASVPLRGREAWIARHGPRVDVVVSHPRLVETGLDLFDKGGGHNFPTLCFYETGYNLFTLRQASRRAWRIGQREPCRVAYLYYADTMQDRALALMGRKLAAAQALEGQLSAEGLAAVAGEDATVEVALARSLVSRMTEADARRSWARVTAAGNSATGIPASPRESPARVPVRVPVQRTLFDDLDDVWTPA